MEAVVDRGLLRLLVPSIEPRAEALAVVLQREVDRRRASERRRARAGREIVGQKLPPNGRSMWVCTSTAPGITYRPVASIVRSGSTTCRPDRRDLLPVDQDVGRDGLDRRDDRALGSASSRRSRPGRHGGSWVSSRRARVGDPSGTARCCAPLGSCPGRHRARAPRLRVGRLRHDLAAGSQKYEEP